MRLARLLSRLCVPAIVLFLVGIAVFLLLRIPERMERARVLRNLRGLRSPPT